MFVPPYYFSEILKQNSNLQGRGRWHNRPHQITFMRVQRNSMQVQPAV